MWPERYQPPTTTRPTTTPPRTLSNVRNSRGLKNERGEAERDRETERGKHDSLVESERGRDQGRKILARGKRRPHRIERRHAEYAEDAFERHVRGERQHDRDDERLEIAGADPDQRSRSAARAQRHADPEEQAAQDVGEPDEPGRGVDRLGEIDEAGELQGACARGRHGDGEQPHAHAVPVAHVDHVRNRAHGAEVRLVAHGAEDECEGKGPPDHRRGERCRVGFGQETPIRVPRSAGRRFISSVSGAAWPARPPSSKDTSSPARAASRGPRGSLRAPPGNSRC